MVRVNRPVQRLIIAVLALILVVSVGAVGISSLTGNNPGDDQRSDEPTAANPDDRPTADPADQPQKPEVPRPEEPAGLTEQTSDGAQATLTYLLESYTYMMTTGDTSVWEDSVDPNCQVCTTFLSNAQILNEQGGYLVDGEFDVRSTGFSGTGEPPATGQVVADFSQEASVIVDDPNLQASPVDAVTGQLIAQVAWDGSRWRVTDMSIAPPASSGASDAGGAG